MAGISPMFFLSYYSTFIVFGIALLMGAMLIGFSQRNTGNKSTSTAVSSSIFLGLLIAGAIVIPLFMVWNNSVLWTPYLSSGSTPDRLDWFSLTINWNPIVTHLFTFTHLTIVLVLLWQILQRAFQNPTATLISKRQSYILAPYFVLLIIGFRSISSSTNTPYGGNIELVEYLVPWLFIGLIFALSTVRQTWFEWICYRKDSRLETEGSSRIQPSRTVINYALLVQWMLMLKTQKRSTWAIGSLFFAIGLPSIVSGLFTSLGNNSHIGQILLMCSPWFRSMLYAVEGRNTGGFGFTNVTIALMIQTVAILFLASRVWFEYRKMVRS